MEHNQKPLSRVTAAHSSLAFVLARIPANGWIEDAEALDRAATDAAETCARIAAIARRSVGNRSGGVRLIRKVRRALGFTYP